MLSRRTIPTAMSPLARLWRMCVVRLRQWHLQTLITFAEDDLLHMEAELTSLPQQIRNFHAAVETYRVRLIDTETELRDLGAKP